MPIKVVLSALAALFLVALPAGVSARAPSANCQSPALYGQSDDQETWFRLPPYPLGRNAEHVYFGNATVEVEIHDLSTTQNFRITDLSWGGTHYDRSTGDPSFTGTDCWLVPLEVRSGVESGDYRWRSDQDPDFRVGLFINHPVVGPPPPPPPAGPPPPAPPPTPPPPPPPELPDLIMTVGPGQTIGAYYADGRRATRVPPGQYTIQVHDLSTTHNFHLTGPGVDEKTEVDEIIHPVLHLTLRAGTYTFKCDVHPSIRGTLVVSTSAPPVPKCKVPRLIGKTLARARRMIRVAHCSVGSIRRARSRRARGRVVSQRPRAGRVLAATAKVNLVVSRGPG
jgi:PASTA domain-containing protein